MSPEVRRRINSYTDSYYNHVIGEGGRSRFAELYEANKGNLEQALRHAIDWWHNLREPPSGEHKTLLQWAPFLRSALSQNRILGLSEGDFEAVCQRVWSIQDHARRVANATLNLQAAQVISRLGQKAGPGRNADIRGGKDRRTQIPEERAGICHWRTGCSRPYWPLRRWRLFGCGALGVIARGCSSSGSARADAAIASIERRLNGR
jgi:hypothetical protein